ncbi:telomere repeat-binding protein 4-like isoform X2 [Tripterygium wilfordii]|uniref:telomere repeat-binding protein 4-like isoform X2 n=1 Tax=Tripterygium wilfordii TaxID=458696 RepID=UPI0018F82145|nr:telomere repeat-binding protein 4-like isoform X2 [Tripterygium wilfordii]
MPEMELKKRIHYGFNGFQVPTIPKAPRSARGRCPLKKTVDDGQICAFEMLASLAGKLLEESESSSASSIASEGNDLPLISDAVIKQEQKDENEPLIADCLNHGSCEESAFVPELGLRKRDGKCFLKEIPADECDSILERASITRNSDFSEKLSSDVKSVICKIETTSGDFRGVTEGGSPDLVESCDGKLENRFGRQQEAEKLVAGYMTMNIANGSKYPMDLCLEFPALVNLGSKVELPTCLDPVPDASFTRHRNGVKLGSRDDDEKFLRCSKFSTNIKAFRALTRTGGRRIRKLLTSKYWKVPPKLKDYDTEETGGLKPFLCHKRKIYQNRGRCQYNSLYKRRKISDRSSVMISDGGFSSDSVSNSPDKGLKREKNGGNGVSPGVMGHQATFHSKDSHVKLSIKSFRVPELFIEVPETATVGSLKRTVMEAVSSILGDGLHVGVVLRGKKVRNDNRTLSQTGISCKDNLDSLDFTLEPKTVQAPPPVCAADPCDTSQLVSRSPENPIFYSGNSDALPNPTSLTNSGNNVECNNESVTSDADTTVDHSRALVPVPAMNIEALAMVPANQKPRRSEIVQRRTRRPFSVAEVEALVHAVEELGTGRWRDVKLRAFEDADHRTYVDLKDKWKTLFHTAKIAPQQRRGEPVPQELLDRVLAAHAYWSHHQMKQHAKLHPGIPSVTETHPEKERTEGIPLIV